MNMHKDVTVFMADVFLSDLSRGKSSVMVLPVTADIQDNKVVTCLVKKPASLTRSMVGVSYTLDQTPQDYFPVFALTEKECWLKAYNVLNSMILNLAKERTRALDCAWCVA